MRPLLTDEVEIRLHHLRLLVGPRAAAHLVAVALAHLFWKEKRREGLKPCVRCAAVTIKVLWKGGTTKTKTMMMNLNFRRIKEQLTG